MPVISSLLTLSMLIFLYTKKKSSAPIINSIISLQYMAFIWSLGKILELTAPNLKLQKLVLVFQNIALDFSGVLWLLFCLYFINSPLLSKKNYLIFTFIPATITFIFYITNNYHHLYYQQIQFNHIVPSVFLILSVIFDCIYVSIGVVLLNRYTRTRSFYVKKQVQLILIALLVPFFFGLAGAANMIFFKDSLPFHHYTSYCFTLTTILVYIAVYRYQFLKLVPIAKSVIVENLSDAVIILNNENEILNYNNSFYIIFINGYFSSCSGNKIKLLNYLSNDMDLSNYINSNKVGIKELIFIKRLSKYFSVSVQPFFRGNEQLGRIISFADVTEYQNMINKILEKNHKLEEYALTVEEITVLKERNRFARDIHDSIGHTLSLLHAILEACTYTYEKDQKKTLDNIRKALRLTDEGFLELRKSIDGLVLSKDEAKNLILMIKEMIKDFQSFAMNIDFFVDGSYDYNSHYKFSDLIYKICQESLTNSFRHGQAKNIAILLRFSNNEIRLFVFDDGKGCVKINKGMGLTGMDQRISEVNGYIRYGSSHEDEGFYISIKIPLT